MVHIYKTIMMKQADNVAVALEDIPAGSTVTVTCQDRSETIKLVENISFGHKFAVNFIAKETTIRKYGEVIGKAVEDIQPGAHVHVNNIEGIRGRGDKIALTR